MQKKRLAVGLLLLVASAVSYELVHLTEASPASGAPVESVPVSGVHAAAVPIMLPVPVAAQTSLFGPVSDAALFAATGAALFVIAAGIRHRAS